jgi:hypothetical protein
MTKLCTKCKVEKPANFDFFYANKKGETSLNNWCKDCHKEYRKVNANKINKISKICKEKNPEKYKELKKAWNFVNKDKKRMYALDYISRKKLRKPKWFGEFDAFVIQEAHVLANIRKKMFGIDWAVDHIIPMCGKMVSGLHVYNNVQVIPSSLNSQKHNFYEVN